MLKKSGVRLEIASLWGFSLAQRFSAGSAAQNSGSAARFSGLPESLAFRYGTASQVAEKRVQGVESAISRTMIQRVTSEHWIKNAQSLPLWFFFQQPVQPCRRVREE